MVNTVSTAGFVVADTSITYGAASDTTTLATLSGVKGTISDPVNGVTTITKDNTNGTKIALKGDGYTLKLDSTGTAPTVTSVATGEGGAWTTKKLVATLSGATDAGYSQTDPNNIAYIKALGSGTKTAAIATISGLKASTVDLDETTTTGEGNDAVTTGKYVTREGSKLTFTDNVDDALSKNITVDGKGVVTFDFAAYSNASITGGKSDDSFTFRGTALTINPGKGADYVNLGMTARGDDTKADTFVYASSDGYDEVANFATGDYLKISKAKKIEVTQDDTNTYINVDGKGTITLDAFNYSAVNISGAKSASLIAADTYDFDSSSDDIGNIVVMGDDAQPMTDYSDSFTLSGSKAMAEVKISFTKKTSE